VKNPNTIRTFLKAVRLECFVLNVLVAALRPVADVMSAGLLHHKQTFHRQGCHNCFVGRSWPTAFEIWVTVKFAGAI
jgi:hypothetical protein